MCFICTGKLVFQVDKLLFFFLICSCSFLIILQATLQVLASVGFLFVIFESCCEDTLVNLQYSP